MSIERRILRHQVRDAIASRIAAGELVPGSNINEAALSKQLNVSRTPLREGLLLLEADGLIQSKANRGFYVGKLDGTSARELFDLVGQLQAAAIVGAGQDVRYGAGGLSVFSAAMQSAELSPAELFEKYYDWHGALLAACGTGVLIDTAHRLLRQARLYEPLLENKAADFAATMDEFNALSSELEYGSLPSAAEIMTRHWQRRRGLITPQVQTP